MSNPTLSQVRMSASDFTGGPCLRCVDCGKVAYATEEQAREACKRVRNGQRLGAYKGTCGWWHLSRTAV